MNELLNWESITGYRTSGKPIYAAEYREEMNQQQKEIENGTAGFISSEELKKKIVDGLR